jgi:hypothetical protein
MFARLNDKDGFSGVVHRNVCNECLDQYINDVKTGKKGRYECLIWLPILLPFGMILVTLADNATWRIIGWIALCLGLILPVSTYAGHRREMRRARSASFEENAKRYCREMCREDVMKTNGQSKLVEIKREYASSDYTAERIAVDAGVTLQTATTIKSIIAEMNDA